MRRVISTLLTVVMVLCTTISVIAADEDREWGWWFDYELGVWHTDEVSGYRFRVDDFFNIYWDMSSGGRTPSTDSQDYNESASQNDDFDIQNGVLKRYTGAGGAVVIPDTVTSIGGYSSSEGYVIGGVTMGAFENCTNITSITIPDSIRSIENAAFGSCSGLTSITIPNGVTYISDVAFQGSERVTIYGYTGSVAEQIASNRNIPFSSIGTSANPIYTPTQTTPAVGSTVMTTPAAKTREELAEEARIQQLYDDKVSGKVTQDPAPTPVTTNSQSSTQIEIQIDNAATKINVTAVTLDQSATIINERTIVPVRFIAESFGAEVDWNNDTQTVTIINSNK